MASKLWDIWGYESPSGRRLIQYLVDKIISICYASTNETIASSSALLCAVLLMAWELEHNGNQGWHGWFRDAQGIPGFVLAPLLSSAQLFDLR